jgi:hypothetical protein
MCAPQLIACFIEPSFQRGAQLQKFVFGKPDIEELSEVSRRRLGLRLGVFVLRKLERTFQKKPAYNSVHWEQRRGHRHHSCAIHCKHQPNVTCLTQAVLGVKERGLASKTAGGCFGYLVVLWQTVAHLHELNSGRNFLLKCVEVAVAHIVTIIAQPRLHLHLKVADKVALTTVLLL